MVLKLRARLEKEQRCLERWRKRLFRSCGAAWSHDSNAALPNSNALDAAWQPTFKANLETLTLH